MLGQEVSDCPPIRGFVLLAGEIVDFMIAKNELCVALEPVKVKTEDPGLLRFKMAYFLLLPGSVRAYDAYLARVK